ncbi:MAG: PadR family transcriptional regulator, partial [Lachnospiraceae bacterium]|nr:PadR family transcriptional regulator [Lachnospiraceae bacterium]
KVQDVIDISESTLYPVLRRLQKDGMLTTYDKPDSGRNRRYYSLTEAGHEKLDYYIREWKEYRDKINTLLGGEI